MRKQGDAPADFGADSPESMISTEICDLLRCYARDAGRHGSGTVVEIGAYRGSSTIALARGICDAGHGKVVSIDPHCQAVGIYGGTFSEADHAIYLNNLEQFGVAQWVEHRCMDSNAAAANWTSAIDLLWIDGDHSYAGVSIDIERWTPLVADQGVVIFDDVEPGCEVEAAIRDHVPFARFRLVERVGRVLVLRKDVQPRILYLCGGMQSSGSTLVSWCFLQRQDLDGVLDMDNAQIHQDFSRVTTDSVWLKMTIGSFRLAELAAMFEAQGWEVRPLLIKRNLTSVVGSLRGKPYGFDGVTGEEPPLCIRLQRYLADLDTAKAKGWPIIDYERLIASPREELAQACSTLGLPWDEGMMTWQKSEASIAYTANGNPTFIDSKQGKADLLSTIASVSVQHPSDDAMQKHDYVSTMAQTQVQTVTRPFATSAGSDNLATLAPSKYWGTQRHYLETQRHQQERLVVSLRNTEIQYRRILGHAVFGRLLRFWQRFINKSFPAAK
ncbi:MAG: class I SAM-dependent methyltransferase [Propionivibrio sp.]|nr:class I SAM-dependent methyltransferase [Propionivibrio sp.]